MRMVKRKTRLNLQGKWIIWKSILFAYLVLRSSRKDKLFDETIGHLQDILIGGCFASHFWSN